MTSNTTFNVYHPQASQQEELYRVPNACWSKQRTFAMGVLRGLPENVCTGTNVVILYS